MWLNPIVTWPQDGVVCRRGQFTSNELVRVVIMMTATGLHNNVTSHDVATPYRNHHLYFLTVYSQFFLQSTQNGWNLFSKKRNHADVIHSVDSKDASAQVHTYFGFLYPVEGTGHCCII